MLLPRPCGASRASWPRRSRERARAAPRPPRGVAPPPVTSARKRKRGKRWRGVGLVRVISLSLSLSLSLWVSRWRDPKSDSIASSLLTALYLAKSRPFVRIGRRTSRSLETQTRFGPALSLSLSLSTLRRCIFLERGLNFSNSSPRLVKVWSSSRLVTLETSFASSFGVPEVWDSGVARVGA